MKKIDLITNLYHLYRDFKKTPLFISGATSIVFGDGNPESPIVFVGEAPGMEEDSQGLPFVGRSGKLLNKALELCGIKRNQVFITNVVKCRPPNNRAPTLEEIEIGKKLILQYELKIISPKLIVTLGSVALHGVTGEVYPMKKVRGNYLKTIFGTVFPLFHPSFILRNGAPFSLFLDDVKNALSFAGIV